MSIKARLTPPRQTFWEKLRGRAAYRRRIAQLSRDPRLGLDIGVRPGAALYQQKPGEESTD